MRPHVLKCVRSRTGTGSVVEYATQELRSVEEDPAYRAAVIEGLVGVVYDESDYTAQHFESLDVKVAAKSGTAERIGHSPTAWYAAFAPVDKPRYVVVSTMEEATWASTSAVYVTRDVLGALFGQPDPMDRAITSIDSVD
jgi:penicillin-binding protein 2